ncbi:hypothetical protein [Neptunomonas marina]|uniref:Uncharacterized protein n=1 Tax=Neptunomonas marina TaxID=1815562 RepID=A0A437Q8Y9_9GAMM|nr:hypothetical protein [Neptunomonas marina]RVU31018.1 hypothetical protein EOE65_08385 [Neptunomonas marina]
MKKVECECNESTKVNVCYTCASCEKPIRGWQLKRKLKYFGLVGVIGYGLGQAMEAVVFDARYPMEVEFSLIDVCINGSGSSLSASQYKRKQSLCLCAVEGAIGDVSYSEFESSKYLFEQSLRRNLEEC